MHTSNFVMITLAECLSLAPVTIYCLGSENEFLSLVEDIGPAKADQITVEFFRTVDDLGDALYTLKPAALVVYGLSKYLSNMDTKAVVAIFTHLSNSGHKITYADNEVDELLAQLVQRQKVL